MLKEIRPAIVLLVALTADHRASSIRWPSPASRGVIFPYQAQGSLIEKDGKVVGSALIGQVVRRRQVFPRPSVGDQRAGSQGLDQDRRCALQRRQLDGLESRPDQQGAGRPRQRRRRQAEEREPGGAGPGRSGDHLGQRARSRHLAGSRAFPGAAGRQGARPAGRARPRPGREPDRGPHPRPAWASRASMCSSSISRSTR